jgi:hypothetical protein
VVPLGVRPDQCFDEITPNNMHTSLTCAFSGAFIVGGGLVVTVWSMYYLHHALYQTLTRQSLRPSALHASANLLGHCTRSDLLLHFTSRRLGSRRRPLHYHNDFDWCLISIWRCLSCELRSVNGRFLGSSSRNRISGWSGANFDVSDRATRVSRI